MRNGISYIFGIMIISVSLISCTSKNKSKVNNSTKDLIGDVDLKIGKNNDLYMYLQYKKNEYLAEILVNNIWMTGVKYNEKGAIEKVAFYNEFNDLEEYYFKNKMLDHMYRYMKQKNGEQELQDIVAYKNGFVDKKNSCYTNVLTINETNENITLEVSFESGYRFVEGEIYFGKEIISAEQAKSLSKVEMKTNPFVFTVDKKKLIFNDSILQLGVLIRTDVNSKIEGFVTEMPDKKIKTFAHFFFVKQIMKK
jgi:hypothetical protein